MGILRTGEYFDAAREIDQVVRLSMNLFWSTSAKTRYSRGVTVW